MDVVKFTNSSGRRISYFQTRVVVVYISTQMIKKRKIVEYLQKLEISPVPLSGKTIITYVGLIQMYKPCFVDRKTYVLRWSIRRTIVISTGSRVSVEKCTRAMSGETKREWIKRRKAHDRLSATHASSAKIRLNSQLNSASAEYGRIRTKKIKVWN